MSATDARQRKPFGEATVEIDRVFDAPRALVWQAWTDPKMMAQWFGPRGFTTPVCELGRARRRQPCASSCADRTATIIR